ncbi:TonB-dependent receptor [Thalassotalea fonticola]|uniref:TonB-dependent receptor n=1 Tax=Thalassotalea fonticola TaxID=3065649 RepID=A0ABZ0GK84_9GAMM|nr:TonB-dependent receptor [Colwelliaceae bacterium S1-1]
MKLNILTKAMLLAGATSLSSYSVAEEADNTQADTEKKLAIEVITVSAQKRLESQQEVALTVNTFDADTLSKSGAFELTDIEKMTAGFSISGESGHDAGISIRGIGAKSISGLDPAVAVFIDGVVQNNVGSAFGSLLDIERIEILRGPQGTLYGKNAPAGAINIITKTPDSLEFGGNVEATYSSWNTQEYKGTVNIPLIEDVLAARVSGLFSESDGYIENKLLDKDANSRERSAARLKLLYTPMENLSAILNVNYSDSEVGNPLQLMGDSIYEFETFENDPGIAEDKNESVSLQIDWELDSLEFTLISAMQDYEFTGPRDNDFSPAEVGMGGSILTIDQKLESESHEFRVTSYDNDKFEFMAGLFYSNQELAGGSLFDNGFFNQNISGVDVTESFGIFTNNTYFLDDDWSVTFGLRYSDDRKSATTTQVDSILGEVQGRDSEHFESFSGSLKLRYMPTTDQTYYVSLDRAYRAGGFNVVAPQHYKEAGYDKYDSETSNAIEIGSKIQFWDNRFQLNTAVFYQEFDDYQYNMFLTEQAVAFAPFFVVSAPAGNVRLNGSDAEAKGAEVEFTVLLSEQLTVKGSVAYNHIEVGSLENVPTTFADAGYATAGPVIIDPRVMPGAGGDTSTIPTKDVSGEVLKGNPQWTSSLFVEYADEFADTSLDWFVRATAKYNGERDKAVLDSYVTADLFAGLRSNSGKWSITAWAKNITDEEYLIFGNDAETSGLGVDVGFPAEPSSYGVTLGYSF